MTKKNITNYKKIQKNKNNKTNKTNQKIKGGTRPLEEARQNLKEYFFGDSEIGNIRFSNNSYNPLNFNYQFPELKLDDVLLSNSKIVVELDPETIKETIKRILNQIDITNFLNQLSESRDPFDETFVKDSLTRFTSGINEDPLIKEALIKYISYSIHLLGREMLGTNIYFQGNKEVFVNEQIPKDLQEKDYMIKYYTLLNKLKFEYHISNYQLFEVLFSCLSQGEIILDLFMKSYMFIYANLLRGFNDSKDQNYFNRYIQHYHINDLIKPIPQLPEKNITSFINEQLNVYIDFQGDQLVVSSYSMYTLFIPSGGLPAYQGDSTDINNTINRYKPFLLGVMIDKIEKNITTNTLKDSFDYYWINNSETRDLMKQIIKFKINEINDDLERQITVQVKSTANEQEKETLSDFFRPKFEEFTDKIQRLLSSDRWSYLQDGINAYLELLSSLLTEQSINEWLRSTNLDQKIVELYINAKLIKNLSFFYDSINTLSSAPVSKTVADYGLVRHSWLSKLPFSSKSSRLYGDSRGGKTKRKIKKTIKTKRKRTNTKNNKIRT